jgi:hypothetical protein
VRASVTISLSLVIGTLFASDLNAKSGVVSGTPIQTSPPADFMKLPPGVPETSLRANDCLTPEDEQRQKQYVDEQRMNLKACSGPGLKQFLKPQPAISGNSFYAASTGPTFGFRIECRQERKNYFTQGLLVSFQKEIATAADKAMAAGDRAMMACVTSTLHEWAGNNAIEALTGGTEGRTNARVTRAIALETFAGLYFKYYPTFSGIGSKLSSAYGPDQNAVIKKWLSKLAGFTRQESIPRLKTPNNMLYRQGNGMLLVGLITGDQQLVDAGRQAFTMGLKQINKDGFLPLELQRGSRARGYHASALAPLINMLVTSKSYGCEIKLSRDEEDRLLLLFARVIQSQLDPDAFIRAAGLGKIELSAEGVEAGNLLPLLSVHSQPMYQKLSQLVGNLGLSLVDYEKKNFLTTGTYWELGGKLLPMAQEAQSNSQEKMARLCSK